MKHEILYSPENTAIKFVLNRGEQIRAESDAMICMSDGIELQTGFGAGKKSGGILKNLLRSVLTSESFFTNTFTATQDGQEILMGPGMEGDIDLVDLETNGLIIQAGSYLCSSPDIEINTKWQGMKSFFSGESMFMMDVGGPGFVVLSAFGGLQKIQVSGNFIVDTGHIVAFSKGLKYSIGKAAKGWISSFLSGEGLICEFSGEGYVYTQSRNPIEYGRFVGQQLAPIVKYE